MAGSNRYLLEFQGTVSNTATDLDTLAGGALATFLPDCASVVVTCDDVVRWLLDAAPTATYGHSLPASRTIELPGELAGRLQFIRAGGVDVAVTVSMMGTQDF